MEDLLNQIRNCELCRAHLPLGPRPVLSIHQEAKIVVIGQAPGTKVHASGVPWDDMSGKTLRNWLGVSDAEFYDASKFAIMPLGFCYPGRGKGGDLPPRPECAPKWHGKLLDFMPQVELVLLIGLYAQKYYLKSSAEKTLTATVANFEQYAPYYFPLPHPSPRNRFWLTRNPWFEQSVVPLLAQRVDQLIR